MRNEIKDINDNIDIGITGYIYLYSQILVLGEYNTTITIVATAENDVEKQKINKLFI